MSKTIDWLVARLQEKSTYAGLAVLAAMVGAHLSPVDIDAITNAVMALAGLAAVLLKENNL